MPPELPGAAPPGTVEGSSTLYFLSFCLPGSHSRCNGRLILTKAAVRDPAYLYTTMD